MTRDEFAAACDSLYEAWSVLRAEGGVFSLMGGGARLEAQVHWPVLAELLAETPVQLTSRYDREYPWKAAVIVGKVRVCALLTTAQQKAAERDGLAVAGEVIA